MLDKSIQIGIVGLGLIGGSIAKTLSKKGFKVYANDLNEESLKNALNEKKIDGLLEDLDQNNPFILIFTIPVLSVDKELIKNKELLWFSWFTTQLTVWLIIHQLIIGLIIWTSHLPHLIAFALMSMISKSKETKKEIFTGGGLKDFTRIASSDPKMWEDIFMSNQINMLEVIKSFKSELDQLEKLIQKSDSEKLNQFITSAKEFRDSLI